MIVSDSLPASEGMSGKCTNHRDDKYGGSLDSNVNRFGCWNVRSVSSREEMLFDKLKRYVLEVLGVSEAKVRRNGVKRIGDATCVYLGVQDCRSKAGVAILLSEDVLMSDLCGLSLK